MTPEQLAHESGVVLARIELVVRQAPPELTEMTSALLAIARAYHDLAVAAGDRRKKTSAGAQRISLTRPPEPGVL